MSHVKIFSFNDDMDAPLYGTVIRAEEDIFDGSKETVLPANVGDRYIGSGETDATPWSDADFADMKRLARNLVKSYLSVGLMLILDEPTEDILRLYPRKEMRAEKYNNPATFDELRELCKAPLRASVTAEQFAAIEAIEGVADPYAYIASGILLAASEADTGAFSADTARREAYAAIKAAQTPLELTGVLKAIQDARDARIEQIKAQLNPPEEGA